MQPKVIPAQVGDLLHYEIGNHQIPYRHIVRTDGYIQIEYYRDDDVDQPSAYQMFRDRMAILQHEYGKWATIVADSVTYMELIARKREEKILNPVPIGKTKQTLRKGDGVHPMQWFGGSTDALEEMLCQRFAWLPMNTVIVCHINEKRNEVSGEILRMPFAPGRLSDRKLLNSAFQEQYYMYTGRAQETNERQHMLKTVNDGQWAATSQIMAPDPCFPHYESLWENWPMERMPISVMVYGDFGVGKSQFAATFPKPMLVFMFDGKGKDLPYWKELSWA